MYKIDNEPFFIKQVYICCSIDPEGYKIISHPHCSPVLVNLRASIHIHKIKPILGGKIEGEKESVQPSRRLNLSKKWLYTGLKCAYGEGWNHPSRKKMPWVFSISVPRFCISVETLNMVGKSCEKIIELDRIDYGKLI
jgi:hypothetical protein